MLRRKSKWWIAAVAGALTTGAISTALAQNVGGGAGAGAGAGAGGGNVGGNAGGNVGGNAGGNVGGNAGGNVGGNVGGNARGVQNPVNRGAGAAGAGVRDQNGNIIPGARNGVRRNAGNAANRANGAANQGGAQTNDNDRDTGARRGRNRANAIRAEANEAGDNAADLARDRARRLRQGRGTTDGEANDNTSTDDAEAGSNRRDRRNQRDAEESDRFRDLRDMEDGDDAADDLDEQNTTDDGAFQDDQDLNDDSLDDQSGQSAFEDQSSQDDASNSSTRDEVSDQDNPGDDQDVDDGSNTALSDRLDRLERLIDRLSSRFGDDELTDEERAERRDDRRDDRADRRDNRRDTRSVGRRDFTISADDLGTLGFDFEAGADADLTLGELSNSSVAARLGLEEGDVITSVNGRSVGSTEELIDAMANLRPGSPLSMEVLRDGETEQLRRTLGGWFFRDIADRRGDDDSAANDDFTPITSRRLQALGFQFTSDDAGQLTLDSIGSASVAARMRLQEGDVIESVNGMPVGSMDDFVEAFADLRPGSRLQLGVTRNGELRSITTSLNRPFFEDQPPTDARITPNRAQQLPGFGANFDVSSDGLLTAGDITDGGFAARLGMRAGDRVVSVNGIGVSSLTDLRDVVGDDLSQAGTIQVLRDGRLVTLSGAGDFSSTTP